MLKLMFGDERCPGERLGVMILRTVNGCYRETMAIPMILVGEH